MIDVKAPPAAVKYMIEKGNQDFTNRLIIHFNTKYFGQEHVRYRLEQIDGVTNAYDGEVVLCDSYAISIHKARLFEWDDVLPKILIALQEEMPEAVFIEIIHKSLSKRAARKGWLWRLRQLFK